MSGKTSRCSLIENFDQKYRTVLYLKIQNDKIVKQMVKVFRLYRNHVSNETTLYQIFLDTYKIAALVADIGQVIQKVESNLTKIFLYNS